MSGPVTPMLALAGTAYANNVYNHGFAPSAVADVKPLLFGGIALLFLELLAAVPGAEPVATALGWLAFAGMAISPVQNPSPAQNILKITGGGSK